MADVTRQPEGNNSASQGQVPCSIRNTNDWTLTDRIGFCNELVTTTRALAATQGGLHHTGATAGAMLYLRSTECNSLWYYWSQSKGHRWHRAWYQGLAGRSNGALKDTLPESLTVLTLLLMELSAMSDSSSTHFLVTASIL